MTEIRTLELGTADALPPHVRSCLYWEFGWTSGPAGVADGDTEVLCDPEFEKEAWLSQVLLEWGPCGQIAVDGARVVGVALYAPPRLLTGPDRYPTAPASSDAVLLTTLQWTELAEPDPRGRLLAAAVADLRARGVRAMEAFGWSSAVDPADEPQGPGPDRCGDSGCMTRTGFLQEHGFEVVAPDPHIPRLRLEIESGHLWKADVERALDQLLGTESIPMITLPSLAPSATPVRVRHTG